MINLLTIFSVFLIWISGVDRGEPDYRNKALLRELENFGYSSEYREIRLPSEIEANGEFTGRFFKVQGKSHTDDHGYLYAGRVNICRSGGCSPSGFSIQSEYENFDYFILFDGNAQVVVVRVFSYQATKGHEITSRGWLKQFQGYSGGSLTVGKEIDGISGATISVYAITEDIKQRTALLRAYLNCAAQAVPDGKQLYSGW